jgi:hypothetical protein
MMDLKVVYSYYEGLHSNSSLSSHASLTPLNPSIVNHLEKLFQGLAEA